MKFGFFVPVFFRIIFVNRSLTCHIFLDANILFFSGAETDNSSPRGVDAYSSPLSACSNDAPASPLLSPRPFNKLGSVGSASASAASKTPNQTPPKSGYKGKFSNARSTSMGSPSSSMDDPYVGAR